MSGKEGDEWTFGEDPGSGGLEDFPGKDVLNLESPRAVLARLTDGDPLGIHEACRQRVDARAFLLDHFALSLRCFARVAWAGPFYRGHPPLQVWLRHRYDQSIREKLSEDVEDELQGLPVDPEQPRVQLLQHDFGLETGLARVACIRFNALPESVRQVFFHVNLFGRTLTEYALSVDASYDRARADLDLALRTLSRPPRAHDLDLPDRPDPTW